MYCTPTHVRSRGTAGGGIWPRKNATKMLEQGGQRGHRNVGRDPTSSTTCCRSWRCWNTQNAGQKKIQKGREETWNNLNKKLNERAACCEHMMDRLYSPSTTLSLSPPARDFLFYRSFTGTGPRRNIPSFLPNCFFIWWTILCCYGPIMLHSWEGKTLSCSPLAGNKKKQPTCYVTVNEPPFSFDNLLFPVFQPAARHAPFSFFLFILLISVPRQNNRLVPAAFSSLFWLANADGCFHRSNTAALVFSQKMSFFFMLEPRWNRTQLLTGFSRI